MLLRPFGLRLEDISESIVISPIFTGAEPNVIDMDEFEGTQILHSEGALGLKLAQSLDDSAKAMAQIFKLLRDLGML
jgi:hypothetical protein